MIRFYAFLFAAARMRGFRSVFSGCCALQVLLLVQATSQTFNASGTYLVPAGYTAVVKKEAWGGGAYARLNNLTLTTGSYASTVGAGGSAANPSTDGGNTFSQHPSGTNLVSTNGGIRGEAVDISTTAVPVGFLPYLALGDLDNEDKLDLAFMNSQYLSVL